MLFRPGPHASTMAKAMTGSFYLTETVQIPAGTASSGRVQGSIDLGAYVNVATGQAVAIESVDFIYQAGADYGGDVRSLMAGNGSITCQLTDLNPGTAFVRADDQSLIASGAVNVDFVNNIASLGTDMYPDQWGPASLAHAFMVVNDTIYFNAGPDLSASGAVVDFITVRIRCQIAKLSSKDWISIAIQSTASDN